MWVLSLFWSCSHIQRSHERRSSRPPCPRRSGGQRRDLCLPSWWLCLSRSLLLARPTALPTLRHPLLTLPFLLSSLIGFCSYNGKSLAEAWVLPTYPHPPVYVSSSDLASFLKSNHEFYWLTHFLVQASNSPRYTGGGPEGVRIFCMRDQCAHTIHDHPGPPHWLAYGLGWESSK